MCDAQEKNIIMLSDEEILKLYQDENFHGSYGSARTLQIFLKTDYNEDVSLARIYKILNRQPFYLYQVKPLEKFPRRSYDVKAFNELWQADVGFCYPKDGYTAFLLVTDVFSSRIWTVLLKNKENVSIKKALEKIFDEVGTPTELSTDQARNINFVIIKSPKLN